MPSLPPEPAPRSDGELLRLFLMSRDQTSLTELVTRHAAMVRGVCHRLLGNTPDADDAFQATFLVLVRQGDRIRRPQSLAAWLYGVAQRIAQRVRRQRSRAVVLVQEEHAMIESDPLAELATRHDVALFDTELARLPEKYRAPIVLHHLEGKTQREIAAELKLTEGAVDGLLKRGRNELRVRLARQGVVFGVTVAVLEQSQQAIAATSSQPLIESTVQSILSFEPVLHPELPRPPSARLAQQEITTMGLYHAGKVAAWTVAASLLFGAAGVGVSTVRHDLSFGTPGLIASELDTTDLPADAVIALASATSTDTKDESGLGNGLEVATAIDQTSSTNEEHVDSVSLTAADFRGEKLSEHPIFRALAEPASFTFVDTKLEGAMQLISKQYGFNAFVPDQLERGVSTDVVINLDLKRVSLRSLLKLMLEPHGLDYIIQDDVMKIVSRETAENFHEMRIYHVDGFGKEAEAMVKDTVGGQWKKPGSEGPGGTIQWTRNGLIVRHNLRTHLAVEQFLNQLQPAVAGQKLSFGTISGDGLTGTISTDPAPAKKLPHQGEKISLVGDIDLDGDGQSDRERFHQIIRDAGMTIDTEIDDNGDWVGNQTTTETKFLVVATIPEQRGSTKNPARQRADSIKQRLQELQEVAKQNGVRIVKLNNFLEELGQPPAKTFIAPTGRQEHFRQAEPTSQRITQALHDKTEVAFVDTTLRDAMNYLEDLHKFDIIINESEITDDGQNPDVTINLELAGVELKSALDLMLEPHQLNYVVKHEVLMITTREKAKSPKYQELRIYNVEGLPPLIDKSQRDKDDGNQKIETAIKDAVGGGEEWTSEGGTSTLQWTPAGLIVRTNQRMHAEIEEFLQQLRRADGQGE